MAEPRTTLSPITKNIPASQLIKMDVEHLMLQPPFLRFMSTVFKSCGMYDGSFHPEAGFLHYAQGRRGLGFDILRTLEMHSGDDAHIRIMQEAQTHKEATNGRRNSYDRDSDLDGNVDDGNPDDRADDGLKYD